MGVQTSTMNAESPAAESPAEAAAPEAAAPECVVGSQRCGVLVRAVKDLGHCKLIIAQGSVVDFSGDATVNAANTGGLGGGGVDGAISRAGGPALAEARQALPLLDAEDGEENKTDIFGRGCRDRIRCGGAVTTVAGDLAANWVIHAVGPAYSNQTNWPEEDGLLRSAYVESIKEAVKHDCKTVGFSLLSAGIFRGGRSLQTVLGIGCKACEDTAAAPVEEIYLVGFKDEEIAALMNILDIQDKVSILVDEFMDLDGDGNITESECLKFVSIIRGAPVTLDELDEDTKALINMSATNAKYHIMDICEHDILDEIIVKYKEAQTAAAPAEE